MPAFEEGVLDLEAEIEAVVGVDVVVFEAREVVVPPEASLRSFWKCWLQDVLVGMRERGGR